MNTNINLNQTPDNDKPENIVFRKPWVKPEIIMISANKVRGGTLTSYQESTVVSTFFHGGGS